MNGTAIVAGSVAQRYRYGGHVWTFAQWVRGLRSLGFRTVFVDRVDSPPPPGVVEVLGLLGGPDGIALLDAEGASVWGLSRPELLAASRDAELVINVMGYLDDADVLAGPRRRVFVDIDPGFPQLWFDLGLADVFAGHDAFITVGTTLATSEVPSCGLDWISTVPPVHLADWPVHRGAPDEPITSVASWRGPFGPIEHRGRTFGLRVHEFRRFLDLPRRTGAAFELALDIEPADDTDRQALLDHGWKLVDPVEAAGTPSAYRGYICRSRAELMIAKHLYVATRGGWFSDRSACYLASGRPVLAQETGYSDVLPTGDGLLAFHDGATAAASIEDLERRYAEHCEAARGLAEEHLGTDAVLPRLLDAVLR